MKHTVIKTAGVLLLSTAMLIGIEAQPQNGKGKGPCGQGESRPPAQTLDLSENQQEQMKALRLDHFKSMKPLKNQMNELKAREQTLISEDEVDMTSIYKIIDEQTALQNKMRKLGVQHRLATREILTDEQLMKLDKRGHGKHFKGHRSGHHPGFHQQSL